MSIVRKTILLIVCVFVVLFAIVYFLSEFIYLRGFEELESKTMEQNVTRVIDSMSVKLKAMDTFCLDWSSWDETYLFAKENDLEFSTNYIDRNLMDATFINSDFNIFLVSNTREELVYGKAYDILNKQEIPLPADYFDPLTTVNVMESKTPVSGITLFSGQPMLTVARPILTSLNEGPSSGVLVIGRFIDEGVIQVLAETTNLSIGILPVPEIPRNPELYEAALSLVNNASIFIKKQGDDTIAGYTYIRDVLGNPALMIKVSMPRDIYTRAMKTVSYSHVLLILIGVVFCVIMVFLIRSSILARLTILSNEVNSIGSKGHISERVHVKGKDELSRLADNINGMLDSLQKSEAKRQSQNAMIENIVAITPNGVLVTNTFGNITLVNEAFRTMFDIKDADLVGSRLADTPALSDISRELNTFINSGLSSYKKELKYVHSGINKVLIASFARSVEEDLYLVFLTDITDDRAKQESFYLTDRLASIGEMASGIAHELNNPLTSIIGLSEIIMRDEVPEGVKEDMGLIKSESHRAAGIVRNLLSFARKNATVKQPAQLNKIINDVLKLRAYEHSVTNIRIVNELDPQLPEIMVDYSQIQQVFINIILNAEYAMANAHGRGILRIKSETDGNMLKISFTDDGPGMEPQVLRHIFDPFFTTKEVGKGTGLGLSISYGIITAHHGKIYAVSEPGKGAAFIIELPLHIPNPGEGNNGA